MLIGKKKILRPEKKEKRAHQKGKKKGEGELLVVLAESNEKKGIFWLFPAPEPKGGEKKQKQQKKKAPTRFKMPGKQKE